MKLYFASSSANWETVRNWIHLAEEYGHEVTHNWTYMVEALGDSRDQDQDPVILREGAHQDRIGVFDCQTLVNLWTPEQAGAMIETGMAIGLGKTIWVCAEEISDIRWNIFWELPQVSRMTISALDFRLREEVR
jgi:hypothetical protein